MSKPNIRHWLAVLFILAAAAVVLWPLLKHGFFITDDGDWMVIRLSAFYQSFREGQFPVRFLGRLNSSYGYPVANFLYPGYLYLGSLLHIIGFSFVDAVKFIFFGSVVAGGIGTFFWLRRRFTASASLLGTLGYIWSPYLLFDIYKRGSVGEVLAMGLIPLALWAMESQRKVLFGLFIAAIVISHNSLAVLFVSLLLMLVMLRQHWKFLPFVMAGLCMSAFFWFPAVFEQRYVIFSRIHVSDPSQYFVSFQYLAEFGLIYILAFFLASRSHLQKVGSRLYLMAFILAIILATPVSAPLWQINRFAQLFQFPYRFLSLSSILAPWVLALAYEEIKPRYRLIPGIAAAIILLIPPLMNQSKVVPVDRPEGYYSTNEATTTVADEYLPIWARVRSDTRAYNRIQSYIGDAKIDIRTATTQKIDVVIHAKQPSIIQINTLYYPGWGILLNDVPVKPDSSNEFGLMRVSVPVGTFRLYAEFRETVPRFGADLVSVTALIITLAYPLLQSVPPKRRFWLWKKV